MLITNRDEMAVLAQASAKTDISGERYFPTVFFPDTATVHQIYEALYWAKGADYEGDQDDGKGGAGIIFKVRVKPEYVASLINDTLVAGGAFVKGNDG